MPTIYDAAAIPCPLAALLTARRNITTSLQRVTAARDALPSQVQRPAGPQLPATAIQLHGHAYGLAIDNAWGRYVVSLCAVGRSGRVVDGLLLDLQPDELLAVSQHTVDAAAEIARIADHYVAACQAATAAALTESSTSLQALRQWSEEHARENLRLKFADLSRRAEQLEIVARNVAEEAKILATASA